MDVKIKFLGAAQTVTGSRHLLDINGFQILIDCGLFQGLKELRLKNWESFPVDVQKIDALMLTHAHIDHTGYLPKLVQEGFQGPVYCTSATADLAKIMLLDAAKLQEEEAEWAKKQGYSKHNPPKPLYTVKDAEATFDLFQPYEFDEDIFINDHISIKFHNAGHILGAAWIEMHLQGKYQRKTITFSGDVGRYQQPILRDPVSMNHTDILLVESTYGDRENVSSDTLNQLADIVNEAMAQGGCLLIPAFAVGRTQSIMYYLKTLMEQGKIPKIPVYLDSPMAINVTRLYKKHFTYHKLREQELEQSVFDYELFNYYRSVPASQAINDIRRNAIIISSSGMCTGGRILHHLYHRLPRTEDTLLFVGYQPKGTRGRRILEGEENIRIFGQDVPRKCHVRQIEGLSAHADKHELLRWVNSLKEPPKKTFVVHGEPESAEAFRETLEAAGWSNVYVPEYLASFTLFESI